MPVSRFDSARRCRLIAYWLRLVAALVFAMVVVGGATRLDRVGAFDRRMAAGRGRRAAARRGRMAGGIREVPDDSAIPAAQPRHDPRRVQDHLLVGMESPAARPAHWRGISAAVPVVPVARMGRPQARPGARRHIRPWRAARRGRVVDGGVGPHRTGQRVAISPRVSPDPGLPHLCRAAVGRRAHHRAGPRRLSAAGGRVQLA